MSSDPRTSDVLTRISSPAELKRLVARLGDLGTELLDKIEVIRSKCSRINGRLGDRIRDCVINSLVIVRTLVERLEERGDLTFTQLQNTELSAQLRSAKRECEERRRDVDVLEAEVRSLRAERRRNIGDTMDLPPPPVVRPMPTDQRELGMPKSSLPHDSQTRRQTNTDVAGTESGSTAMDRRCEGDLVRDRRHRGSTADLVLARIDERICALLAMKGRDTAIPPSTGIFSDAGGGDPPRRGRGCRVRAEPLAPPLQRESEGATSPVMPVDPTEWVTVSRRTRRRVRRA